MESVELKFNNTWGARRKEPFFSAIEKETKEGNTPAIYCLQEVFSTTDHTREDAWTEPQGELKPRVKAQLWPSPQANQFQRLHDILGRTHRGFFSENKKGNPYHDLPVPKIDYDLSFGHATFVRNDIPVLQEGKVGVIRHIEDDGSEEYGDSRGTLQWLQVDINGKNVIIAQFHGLRSRQGKGDTPERIR